MDIKRTIIAVVVAFGIMFGHQFLSMKMGWISPVEERPAEQEQAVAAPDPAPVPQQPVEPTPSFVPSPGRLVTVDTPLYRAVIHTGGGILQEFSLKGYRTSLQPDSPAVQLVDAKAASQGTMGLVIDSTASWSGGAWRYDGEDAITLDNGNATIRLVGEVNGLRLSRNLVFAADSYAIREEVSLEADTPRSVNLRFTLGTSGLADGDSQYNKTRVAYYRNDSFKEEDSEKKLATGLVPDGQISWAGIMSNYFLVMLSPDQSVGPMRAVLRNDVYRVSMERDGIILNPGQQVTVGNTYYLGPKDQNLMAGLPNDMDGAVNYGFFSIIARPLMAMLTFFHGFVGNWGVAIILLTLIIKIVLWPLSHKSYKSMQQMKKLQPMMQKLKEKHGDDKEALNREMMQLYKTYKINPAGGCLPILVQIPIFIGLYQGLMNAIALRHAAFITHLPFTDMVWLADLSVKDPFYITPLLMGGTMFLQQWMSPAAADPTQAKIMMIMPVVFTFMFLNFPAGLVIYWLTNNIISIGQQWWQLRNA